MTLTKIARRGAAARKPGLSALPGVIDRREFLKRSGLSAALGSIAVTLPTQTMAPVKAASGAEAHRIEYKRTICPHCAVGCSINATVENGVWTHQEAAFESPINLGSHCAKGAAARDETNSDRRLKTPMKLDGGKWRRVSWNDALDAIAAKLLDMRKESGPDAAY